MRFDNSYDVSPVYCDSVVITSTAGAGLANQFMAGAVGGASAVEQDTVAQLQAVAYKHGVALSPQPSFKWYSSNPNVGKVDQSGNVSRTKVTATATASLTYDNNSIPNLTGSQTNVGGVVQITAAARDASGREVCTSAPFQIAVQAAGDSAVQRSLNSRTSVVTTGVENKIAPYSLDGTTNDPTLGVTYNNESQTFEWSKLTQPAH